MMTDTIAAIATAVSNGGISIIRISGNEAFSVIDKIYRSKSGDKVLSLQPSHTVHYGYIVDGENVIDEVMVLIMKAPKTYTREDVVEIDCHGGITVTKKIVEVIMKNGARIAEPGEFTKRAFLNGRIDLSQAEAVSDIINAKNEFALRSSISQLKGNIKEKIIEIRNGMIHDVAYIESALDDPEHISIDGFGDELSEKIKNSLKELHHLLDNSDNGRMIKEGIKTVIIGKPNAGKSSLLNVLLGEERAIVTDIAGTTRDTLEETTKIGDVVLNLVDTAGIRETENIVEKLGVDRARNLIENCDFIIYVVDGTTTLDENDKKIIEDIKNKEAVVLCNKTDLKMIYSKNDLEKITGKDVLLFSTINREGLHDLEKYIVDKFYEGKLNFNDEIYITNIRQKEALTEAINSLNQVLESIDMGMPEDFFTIDMMNAYESLGKIIGENAVDELVDTIFREFCMGK